jgi:PAS domain S-box-containing protein
MSCLETPLGLFIEDAPVAVAMFDREMCYLGASSGWRRDFGLGDRQLWGLSHYEVFPEIVDRWKQVHRRALAGEVLQQDRDQFERLDGSLQWLRWVVRPWYQSEESIGGIVIFSEDITARVRAEEDLRLSEERYRCLVEATSDVVWNGKRVGDGMNVPQWRELTGQTPEQARSDWAHLIHPEDRDAVASSWLQFVEKGGVFKKQYRLRCCDGQYHWLAVNGISLHGEDGAIREWIGTFNDITDRKLAEEALRRKEEEYRSIFEQALEGIYRTTPEGRSLAANPALAKLLGYESAEEFVECVRDTASQFWAFPAERQRFTQQLDEGKVVRGFECQLVRKDGEKVWVSLNCRSVRDPNGRALYYEGFIEDIHDRKQAEQKVRQSEAQERARAKELETILDTIPIPVLIARDPECQQITRNRAALEQLGIESAENGDGEAPAQADLRHYFLQDGNRLPKEDWPLEQAAALGRPVHNVATTLVREDGTKRYEIGNAAPLRDEHGNVWGAVAAGIDITDRVRAEEALRGSEERLRLAQEVAQIGSSDRNMVTGEVTWSSTLAAIYGLRPGQFPMNDQEYLQLIHPEDRARVSDLLTEARTSGEGSGEWRALWPDGTLRWITCKWRVMKDAAGNPVRSIVCHYDITERKLIEGELEKAKERLTEEKLYLEQEIDSQIGAREIIGATSGLKSVMENVAAVAPTDSTVLLMGETGTGKEVIARVIHENSKRAGRSFIKVNCAAIPSGLLESELFGAERGAFTGAVTRKIGRIELADGGTLFLDEIGEILPSLQPKLLRVLQEQEFERLGGTRTLKVDFRLIAATNRDLVSEVRNNRFRSDLYYRLSVFPISLPPLRDRIDDIPLLVEHFVQKYASRMGKDITSIPKSTMDALLNGRWPGNIRELENFIERSVILTNGSVLTAPLGMLDDDHPVHEQEPKEETATANETLASIQRELIVEALRRSKGRISGPRGAAARLGLKRTTLQSRMKQMGINPRAVNPFNGEAIY